MSKKSSSITPPQLPNTQHILKIDYREADLVSLLTVPFINENLLVGDINITDNNNNTLIVIERKKYPDLCASIKDGRYKEQKERIINAFSKKVRKIYLLEGNDLSKFKMPAKTFQSVIVNTLIRDNIMVFESKNVGETIAFLETIYNNMPKYYNELCQEIVADEDPAFENKYSCKKSKKENINTQICFRNQLCVISGVSTTIAEIFSERFSSMNNFLSYLNTTLDGNKTKIIQYISEEKFGKSKRRIGAIVAERIYDNLFSEQFIPVIPITPELTTETKENNIISDRYPSNNSLVDLAIATEEASKTNYKMEFNSTTMNVNS